MIRVMLADDHEVVRVGFRMILEQDPDVRVVAEAADGAQAYAIVAREKPDILLMDESTSALDPISTSKIEDLAMELKNRYTVIMVTHNMQQAVRVSDKTAFFLLGELVEFGDTERVFSHPQEKRTEDYITGRFG